MNDFVSKSAPKTPIFLEIHQITALEVHFSGLMEVSVWLFVFLPNRSSISEGDPMPGLKVSFH